MKKVKVKTLKFFNEFTRFIGGRDQRTGLTSDFTTQLPVGDTNGDHFEKFAGTVGQQDVFLIGTLDAFCTQCRGNYGLSGCHAFNDLDPDPAS